VLPLFGGIYKRGAGIGPAVAFLYSGPAINVLAIVYTARILGFDLGLARAIGAVAFAAGIGLIMALIYRKEESLKDSAAFDTLMADPEAKKWWQQIIFFAVMVGILIFATSKNWIITGVLLVILGFILWRWFNRRRRFALFASSCPGCWWAFLPQESSPPLFLRMLSPVG
ncbi:permease, partial [Chloroflexota bacterium]